MSLALASAWQPRGEFPRFVQMLPDLQQVYPEMVITLPPNVPAELRQAMDGLAGVRSISLADWSWGRHIALREALAGESSHVQYVDFDRLLHWVETRPEEWLDAARRTESSQCLLVGRTPLAYQTHPQALQQTEAVSNLVVSHLVGRMMDVSAGCKGFHRRAVEMILKYSQPGHALGTDGEWPVLLHRLGFRIDYLEVDGLDWESADRYQSRAAGAYDQRRASEAYDADPKNWQNRVRIAGEIIEYALQASQRELID